MTTHTKADPAKIDPRMIQIRDQQRATWDTFSVGWKQWDELVLRWLSAVGEELIGSAQLHDSSQLLDVAAGTGEPGLSAASRVPKGKVTSTDLSDRMLEVAAENAAQRGIKNFETRQCDAGALPFGENSFDAVTCRFGFMFFPDIHAGLTEMVRVAKPGARICAAVWNTPDKNPWATTIISTIAANVAMPPAQPDSPGLFRCAAPGFMDSAYREAGLRNSVEKELAGELAFASPEQYWDFMTAVAAPVVAGLSKADESTHAQIKRAVLDLVRQTATDGTARLRWSALTICGEK